MQKYYSQNTDLVYIDSKYITTQYVNMEFVT